MDNKQIIFLDGSLEERVKAMKEFFGLSFVSVMAKRLMSV